MPLPNKALANVETVALRLDSPLPQVPPVTLNDHPVYEEGVQENPTHELEVMRVCSSHLTGLSHEARQRALAWLTALLV